MSMGVGSYNKSPELPSNVSVGKYSSIAEDCFFHNGDDHLCVENRKVVYSINWAQSGKSKKIRIGNDVWLCRGVKVMQGVKIGDGAIIGAWSVVAKDIPPYAVAVGNPATVKKYRFTEDQIEQLLKIKWWNWSRELIDKRMGDLMDINLFIKKYGKRN